MIKKIILLLCATIPLFSFSQDEFEGRVIYKFQELNPNPNIISDEDFYASIPNEGISRVVLYIKGNKYKYEYPDKIEIYIPSKNQIAKFLSDSTIEDSVYYEPGYKMDDYNKKNSSSSNEVVMGYSCQTVEFNNNWSSYLYFYNPEVLKTNSSYWKNHKVDYFNDFTRVSNSFPLMIMKKSMLGNYGMMAIKIEPMEIDDKIFDIVK